MDEKKTEHLKTVPPSLTAAIRRARVEGAEQNQAVADLRDAEIARLQLLEEAVRPIIDQLPETIDLFDAGIAYGERPRLFIDMIGFVEMAHDRRTYRFLQDTRHGRVLITEGERLDKLVAAITNYIGRRLVERERALASDWRSKEAEPPPKDTRAKAAELTKAAGESKTAAPAAAERPREASGWLGRAVDVLGFILMVVGSATVCLLVGLVTYPVWEDWARGLWAAWIGTPPF